MYNSWQPPPPGVAICAIVAKLPSQAILSTFVKVGSGLPKAQYSVAIRSAGAAATPRGPAWLGDGAGLWTPLKKLAN